MMPAGMGKKHKFNWVDMDSDIYTARAKITGGWLVAMHVKVGIGLCFVPDPKHLWDGSSLPD